MAKKVVRRPTSIPSKSMRDYLDAVKTETRLIGPIERHLLSRPAEERPTDVLHPSAIVKDDWCLRGSYHLLRGAELKKDNPRLRLQTIFDEGHTIHRKWQGWLYGMGNLYGVFRCRNCNHRVWAQSPTKCEMCDSISLLYDEVPLGNARHRIAGHSDGWVVGLGGPALIEIKSIGLGTIRAENPGLTAEHDGDLNKCWRDIRRPFPTHLRQGLLYLELLNLMTGDDKPEGMAEALPQEIVFLYELKADQSYKEFVVRRNPALIAPILEAALDVVYAVNKGRIPDCNVGGSDGCAQCKPFRHLEAA